MGRRDDRSLSPRRRPPLKSRDVSPSRHRKLPQHRRRIEEMDHSDRDYVLRGSGFSEYYNRDRDRDRGRYSNRGRGCRSSERLEERDQLDRNSNLSALRFSDNDYINKDRYAVVGTERGSPRRIEDRDGFDRSVVYPNYENRGEGKSERVINFDRKGSHEDLYHVDLSSTKFQSDNFDNFSVRHRYSCRIADTDVTRGGEKDHYPQNRYLVSDRARLFSAPQYLDAANPAPIEYESRGRMNSCSCTFFNDGADEKSFRKSGGDGGSLVSSQYLNINTDKQRYVDLRNELHSERRDGLHDLDRETYKFKEQDNLLSSQGYLKGDSDYMASSSRSLGILKEEFPGYSLDMSLDLTQRGRDLPSLPVDTGGYGVKNQNAFPKDPRLMLHGVSGSSGLFNPLPKERPVDLSYGESSRIVVDSMRRLNDVEGDYRDHHMSRTRLDEVVGDYSDQHVSRTDHLYRTIDEGLNKSRMGDDGQWGQDPFFQVQSRSTKFDALHSRDQCMDMPGTGDSRLHYVSEGSVRYGAVKPGEHHSDVNAGQWSHFERSSQLREYDASYENFFDIPKRPPMAELSMDGHSERKLRKERASDELLYEHDGWIGLSTEGKGSHRTSNQQDEEDVDLKCRLSRSAYEKMWKESSGMSNNQPSSSRSHSHHSEEPRKSDSRDIKKRLGPAPQKLHVSQRLVDKRKPSVMKRLKPAKPKKLVPPPWLKRRGQDLN